MEQMLDVTRVVTLDGAGSATRGFGPAKYREPWQIKRFTTQGTSALEPVLNIYRGAAGGSMIDTTRRGNSAVSETDVTFNNGETLTAVYSGGSPGAAVQFHIEGTINYGVPG